MATCFGTSCVPSPNHYIHWRRKKSAIILVTCWAKLTVVDGNHNGIGCYNWNWSRLWSGLWHLRYRETRSLYRLYLKVEVEFVGDFRLPPRRWELRSFGLLRRSRGDGVPAFRENLSLQQRTDRLSRNVGMKLTQLAALRLRKAQFSGTVPSKNVGSCVYSHTASQPRRQRD